MKEQPLNNNILLGELLVSDWPKQKQSRNLHAYFSVFAL